MYKKIIFIILPAIIIFGGENIYAKKFIANIFIDRKEVFDKSDKDWFFAADLANSIHTLTKQYIIEDELLFKEDDELNKDLLYETVRNLRATNLFTKVSVTVDSISPYYYDVYLTTQDKWSTYPVFIFGTGGSTTNLGGGFEEFNLFGTGGHLRLDAFNRTENNIGLQGSVLMSQRRIFQSEYFLNLNIEANKYRTNQLLSFSKPFRAISTKLSYGILGKNNFGRDFLFSENNGYILMPFKEQEVQMWFSRSWLKNDRVFATAYLDLNRVDRGNSKFQRAFDNSGNLLFAFSSVAENYFQTDKLNTYEKEDVPIGGWGTAIIGKVFPIEHNGENLYYVAGQGEKSYLVDNFYFFAQITGASGFSMARGRYTYEEVMAKAFYRFNKNLLIATRFRQQTVWNWDKLRQLILDNDAGLRGYAANTLVGDNRIIFNSEFRILPDYDFWIFKLGGVLFWDIGSVWNQTIDLSKTRWHNSSGFGIRFFNMKEKGENNIFRLDFAFNFDKRKFGEIIFTTNQLFSVFQKHQFHLPQLYGTEFDYE